MNKSAYCWGQILAIIGNVHEYTPAELNNAVAYPLYSFGSLMSLLSGKLSKQLDSEIGAILDEIYGISLPESFSTVQQGDVWIGYYHKKKQDADKESAKKSCINQQNIV